MNPNNILITGTVDSDSLISVTARSVISIFSAKTSGFYFFTVWRILMSGVPRSEKSRLKIILVGGSGVGKTCLISAFLKKPFDPAGLSTVSPAYMFQEVTRKDGLVVCLQIWDTAGQERYRSVSQLFFRDADVALVCFDAGNEESVDTVPDWVALVKQEVPDCEFIIVATKGDLIAEGERMRVMSDAELKLAQYGARGYYFTSAVTRDGVDELFTAAAELFVSKQRVKKQPKEGIDVRQNQNEKKGCSDTNSISQPSRRSSAKTRLNSYCLCIVDAAIEIVLDGRRRMCDV
jgi:small GTP-binding protein